MEKFRLCGGNWVCCNGQCNICIANNIQTTSTTSSRSTPLYSNRTEPTDCDGDDDYDPNWDDDGDCTCFD